MVYEGINYSSCDLYTNLILRCLTLQVDTSGCRKDLGNQEMMGKTSSLYHPGNSVPSSGVSNGWKNTTNQLLSPFQLASNHLQTGGVGQLCVVHQKSG